MGNPADKYSNKRTRGEVVNHIICNYCGEGLAHIDIGKCPECLAAIKKKKQFNFEHDIYQIREQELSDFMEET